MQSTCTILMIRPANFGFNAETGASNVFQNQSQLTKEEVQTRVTQEFDAMCQILSGKGIRVLSLADTIQPIKPDAVFPNNWLSMHTNGTAILYPMEAENRRLERRQDLLEALTQSYSIKEIKDFSAFEQEEKYLEGTGSMVLDRINKIAYACISTRMNVEVLEYFCQQMGYQPLAFHAQDESGVAIYHTNVMMSVGEQFATVCLEAIHDEEEKKQLLDQLGKTNHEIIDISLEQMRHFAGNMLQVKSQDLKEDYIVLSQAAYESLSQEQKKTFGKYAELLPVPIPTIETIGGGSVRCMMAEVFLSPKEIAE